MARFASRFLIDLLMRRTQAEGGFAMIVHKGDEHGGGILLQCRDRGCAGSVIERRWSMDGEMLWDSVGPASNASEDEQKAYLDKRIASDPDLWIVELDIANAAQLVATWLSNA